MGLSKNSPQAPKGRYAPRAELGRGPHFGVPGCKANLPTPDGVGEQGRGDGGRGLEPRERSGEPGPRRAAGSWAASLIAGINNLSRSLGAPNGQTRMLFLGASGGSIKGCCRLWGP